MAEIKIIKNIKDPKEVDWSRPTKCRVYTWTSKKNNRKIIIHFNV